MSSSIPMKTAYAPTGCGSRLSAPARSNSARQVACRPSPPMASSSILPPTSNPWTGCHPRSRPAPNRSGSFALNFSILNAPTSRARRSNSDRQHLAGRGFTAGGAKNAVACTGGGLAGYDDSQRSRPHDPNAAPCRHVTSTLPGNVPCSARPDGRGARRAEILRGSRWVAVARRGVRNVLIRSWADDG